MSVHASETGTVGATTGPSTPAGGRRRFVAQASRFAGVGTAGTVLQLTLYAVLTGPAGTVTASVVSWTLSTLVTNAVHRSVSFGVHGRHGASADQVVALLSSLVTLWLGTVVTAALATGSTTVQLVGLTAVNAIAGTGRFLVLRWWLTHPHTPSRRHVEQSSVTVAELPARRHPCWSHAA